MRTAILDDEPLAIEILENYVSKTKLLKLVYAGSDAFSLLQKVQSGEIDLVFLDIQMPDLSGIQFLKIIGNQCKIIITTAYTAYALDGYEYNITDYLLKPISFERFCKAVEKLDASKQDSSQSNLFYTNPTNYIFVKSEHKTLKIKLSEILYIKSLADYVAYYLLDQNKILSLDTLKSLSAKLLSQSFVQIHKSYIINLEHIDYIERNRVILTQGGRLPIGDSYRKRFFDRMK